MRQLVYLVLFTLLLSSWATAQVVKSSSGKQSGDDEDVMVALKKSSDHLLNEINRRLKENCQPQLEESKRTQFKDFKTMSLQLTLLHTGYEASLYTEFLKTKDPTCDEEGRPLLHPLVSCIFDLPTAQLLKELLSDKENFANYLWTYEKMSKKDVASSLTLFDRVVRVRDFKAKVEAQKH